MGAKFRIGQTVEVIGPQEKLDALSATGIIGRHYTIVGIDNHSFPLYQLEGSNWHSAKVIRSVDVHLGGELVMQKFRIGQTVEVIGPQIVLDMGGANGVIGNKYVITDISGGTYRLEGRNWHVPSTLKLVGITLGGE